MSRKYSNRQIPIHITQYGFCRAEVPLGSSLADPKQRGAWLCKKPNVCTPKVESALLLSYTRPVTPQGLGEIIQELRRLAGLLHKEVANTCLCNREIGFKLGIGRQLANLGRCYFETEERRLARDYLLGALNIFREIGAAHEVKRAEMLLKELRANP